MTWIVMLSCPAYLSQILIVLVLSILYKLVLMISRKHARMGVLELSAFQVIINLITVCTQDSLDHTAGPSKNISYP